MLAATTENVRHYLLDLQARLTGAVSAMDGGSFVVDPWSKPAGETLQVLRARSAGSDGSQAHSRRPESRGLRRRR